MKTFICDLLDRVKRFDESLDIKTILCNKPWLMFDDEEGLIRSYIFKTDGGLIVTSKGKGRENSWEYLPANKTIKVKDITGEVELFHPTFFDEFLLTLNLDATQEYTFLVNSALTFKPKSLNDIIVHIDKSLPKAVFSDKSDTPKKVALTPPTPPIPRKELNSPERVFFAGQTFTRANRDGKSFYIFDNTRYAFSEFVHFFEEEKALLVKTEKDGYVLYYNDTLENRKTYYSIPSWQYYQDGLKKDGLIINDSFLFFDGKWMRCSKLSSNLINGNYYFCTKDENPGRYFKGTEDTGLAEITYEEYKKAEESINDNDSGGFGVIIVFLIIFVIILAIIAGLE